MSMIAIVVVSASFGATVATLTFAALNAANRRNSNEQGDHDHHLG